MKCKQKSKQIFLFTDGAVQKEPHLNGGSELSPRVPVEVPPMVEPIEPEPEEPEIPVVVPATIVPDVEESIKIPEPEIVQPVEPLVPAVEEVQTVSGPEEKSEEPPAVVAPVAVTTQQPVTAPETNEKPTYANLFKKSGSAVVATGSISLPPAGFGKQTNRSHFTIIYRWIE